MALTPYETLTLRMLQRGRGTVSDGRDWLRLVVCVLVTTPASWVVTLSTGSAAAALAVAMACLAAGATWCVLAGNRAAKALVAELQTRR